jgi:hypothetical protein
VSSRIVVRNRTRATSVTACAFMRTHREREWLAHNVNCAHVDDDQPRVVRGNGRALCSFVHDELFA